MKLVIFLLLGRYRIEKPYFALKPKIWLSYSAMTLLLLICNSCEVSTIQNEDVFIKSERSVVDIASSAIGVSLGLFASDPLWNYQSLTTEITDLGVQHVLIVIPLKQTDYKSNNPILGVPIEVIRKTIQQSQALNLKISLMPLITLENRRMDHWRGILAPSDPSLWWRNYSLEMRRIGFLAESFQIERLIVGAELSSLENETAHWRKLILNLRTIYKGRLTYSANWDHYRDISFWDALDEVSVTAYFPIQSIHSIESDWQNYLDQVQEYAHVNKKPFIITEYGYPSLSSALHEPWNEAAQASLDQELQAILIERATRKILSNISEDKEKGLQQAFLWNWFGKGGSSDSGYTLRGKTGADKFRRAILERERSQSK